MWGAARVTCVWLMSEGDSADGRGAPYCALNGAADRGSGGMGEAGQDGDGGVVEKGDVGGSETHILWGEINN